MSFVYGETVLVPRARNAHFRVDFAYPHRQPAIDAATQPLYCVLTKRAGAFSGSRKRSERETCDLVEYPYCTWCCVPSFRCRRVPSYGSRG